MNQKSFWVVGVVLAVVLPILYTVSSGQFKTAAVLVGAIFFLMLFRRPDLWWTAIIATLASGINAVVTTAVSLSDLMMSGFVALSVFMLIFRAWGRVPPFAARSACISLFCIVFLTACWRGWGLQVLGSKNWGGMQYVSLLTALIFYIHSAHIKISEEVMWRTLNILFLLALLPAIGFLLAHFIPAMAWIGIFIRIGTGDLLAEAAAMQWNTSEISRWQIMEYPAIWTGLFALFLYDRKFKVTRAVLTALVISFIFLGLSGHRTVVVMISLTMAVYLTVRHRTIPSALRLQLAVGLLVMIAFLYVFAVHLPPSFQRTVAWLPGINIGLEAKINAASTSTWRIEMWRELMTMIPDYLLVGRGMGFNLSQAYIAYTSASDVDSYQFFIALHNYHNGPIWLILDLGLWGALAGIGFVIGGIIRYGRVLKTIPEGTRWKTACAVFYSFFVASIISFFAVIGGQSFFTRILVLASILEVITQSVQAEQRHLAKIPRKVS